MRGLRTALALTATLALAVGAAACGDDEEAGPAGGSSLSDQKTSITIGLASHVGTYTPLYLAVDEGYFEQEGLDVELVAFQGGSDVLKATIGGSVDIAVSAPSEMIGGVQQGQPLKAFWGGFNQLSFEWWASPSIKSVADAKGKTWGVSRIGSSTDFLTRFLLTQEGLDPDRDARIIGVGPPAGAEAAMKADKIQVAIAPQPSTFVYEEEGFSKIAELADHFSQYPMHVSYSTEEFQRDNPQVVEAYLRALVRGMKLAKSDRAAAEAAMAKYVKVPEKYLAKTYDAYAPGWDETGAIPNEKDMDTWWEIGIENKQFKEKLPEDAWLNRTWLDGGV